METHAHFQSSPHLAPQVPGKLAPLHVPQWGPHGERYPFLEPSLHILHFRVPSKAAPPPSRFYKAPIETDALFQSPPSSISQSPQ